MSMVCIVMNNFLCYVNGVVVFIYVKGAERMTILYPPEWQPEMSNYFLSCDQ